MTTNSDSSWPPAPNEVDDPLRGVLAERRRLIAIGYRMLGTIADAEDAAQETYIRWYRMTDAERAAIANPQGWLTQVMSRVCLDVLSSARVRREKYVGEWLPEPVPSNLFSGDARGVSNVYADPLDRVSLEEEVSTALLIVMESMTAAERVAFVLHDVFAVPFDEIATIVGRTTPAVRQLASSARRRVREHDVHPRRTREHDDVVSAFAAACEEGDLASLMALLDPSVALRVDGGGMVNAARRPVLGVSNVARFIIGVVQKQPSLVFDQHRTGDGIALVIRDRGQLRGVMNIKVRGGSVTDVWLQVNPAKLGTWPAMD